MSSSVAIPEATLDCPVCSGPVSLDDDAVVHELIDCGECASELEVVSLDPARVEEAPESEEDWGE